MKLVRITTVVLGFVAILFLHGLAHAAYAGSSSALHPEPLPTLGHPALEQILWRAANFPGEIVASSEELSFTADGNAVVILVPAPGQLAASIDTAAIRQLGGRVLSGSRHLIRAALPTQSLIPATQVRGVRYIRTPVRPQPQKVNDIHRPLQHEQPKLRMSLDSDVGKNIPSWRATEGWYEHFIYLDAVAVGDVVYASVSCAADCCDLALVRQEGDSRPSLVAWALPAAGSRRHLRFLVVDEGSYALAVWKAAGGCGTVELLVYSHGRTERLH